jgi:ABC-2 type transport system permease protein
MNKSAVIARGTIASAVRSPVIVLMTTIFVASSLVSLYVGSATIRTETKAYELIRATTGDGAAAGSGGIPSLPVLSPLSVMHNTIEYVVMIGALLAVFLGFDAVSRDYEERTLQLILSRPVYRDQFLRGRIVGGVAIITVLQALALLIEAVGLVLIGGASFSGAILLRILAFHLTAELYMVFFLILALLFSTMFLRSLPAFLASVSVWVVVSYVIPEIAKSIESFVVTAADGGVQTGNVQSPVSRIVGSLSPATHFRNVGEALLSPGNGTGFPAGSFLVLIGVTVVAGTISILLFNSREIGKNE